MQEALDRVDGDLELAAEGIYDGPKKLAIEVITIGLNTIKARRRAANRRALRHEIQPQYRPGKRAGSFVMTSQSRRRLMEHTQQLFGPNGWKIGDIRLGEFTKEGLIDQAIKERQSAKGHIQNALFYETLAEPLQPGQRVREYWKDDDATKVKNKIWRDAESRKADLI